MNTQKQMKRRCTTVDLDFYYRSVVSVIKDLEQLVEKFGPEVIIDHYSDDPGCTWQIEYHSEETDEELNWRLRDEQKKKEAKKALRKKLAEEERKLYLKLKAKYEKTNKKA